MANDNDEENNNSNISLFGLLLIVLIGIIIVCGGFYVCKYLFFNKQEFGKVDVSNILSMGSRLGEDFNY